MKATGIVRRIDDLGRVVIPKEIRRTMRIREGDPPRNIDTIRQVLHGDT
jgi:bifunctional DNA-binding transcriptional regulator/antitoxin component of YhaV-PrlF toxin-antitoxin module